MFVIREKNKFIQRASFFRKLLIYCKKLPVFSTKLPTFYDKFLTLDQILKINFYEVEDIDNILFI